MPRERTTQISVDYFESHVCAETSWVLRWLVSQRPGMLKGVALLGCQMVHAVLGNCE